VWNSCSVSNTLSNLFSRFEARLIILFNVPIMVPVNIEQGSCAKKGGYLITCLVVGPIRFLL